MIWIALSIVVAGFNIYAGLVLVAKSLNDFKPTQVIIGSKYGPAEDGYLA